MRASGRWASVVTHLGPSRLAPSAFFLKSYEVILCDAVGGIASVRVELVASQLEQRYPQQHRSQAYQPTLRPKEVAGDEPRPHHLRLEQPEDRKPPACGEVKDVFSLIPPPECPRRRSCPSAGPPPTPPPGQWSPCRQCRRAAPRPWARSRSPGHETPGRTRHPH